MAPSAMRRMSTTAVTVLLCEELIQITTEEDAVIGKKTPGALLQAMRDYEGGSAGNSGVHAGIHIAPDFGRDRGVLGESLRLGLLRRGQHGGHGFPDLAADGPGRLVAEEGVGHLLILADARRGGGISGGLARTGAEAGQRKFAADEVDLAGIHVVLDEPGQKGLMQ